MPHRQPSLLRPALLATLALLGGAMPASAGAQPTRGARGDTLATPSLPREVARDVTARFNAPAAARTFGRYELAAGATLDGDLAVLDGPVVIAGHVTGRVTTVNADVTFRPGARVDGDVLVVGGVVEGRLDADMRGEFVRFRQPLRYTRLEDRLVPEAGEEEDVGNWFRWRRTDAAHGRRTTTGITISSGKTYNRVEGFPIHVGPSLEHDFGSGRVRVDLLGIFRTAEQFAWDSANVGHLARAELRFGRGLQARVGGRLYDQVTPVESWQLDGAESGLAAFLARRDFRDWFGRHGGTVYASLLAGPDASLTVALADERWAARGARDVFTLFRNGATWRPNPLVDEGRVHVLNATLRLDTRNDVDRPWSGWYVEADYEHGTGAFTRIAPTSASLLDVVGGGGVTPGVLGARDLTPGRRTYGRGFVDVRRYNRLTPDAQLNFRAVLGGWLHGDELPMQRRLSVTGPGALAGFDFRQPAPVGSERSEVGQCAVGGIEPAGSPAQCDRMVLLQAEYRGDVRVRLFGDDEEGRPRRRAFRTDLSWVVFADAGRGWLVGPRDLGRQVYPSGSFPTLGSFLADVGAGVDFGSHRANALGSIGIYVAKAATRPGPGANVIVRARRRF